MLALRLALLSAAAVLTGCAGAALVEEPLRRAQDVDSPSKSSGRPPGGAREMLEAVDAVWVVGADGSLVSKSLLNGAAAAHLENENVVAIHSPRRGDLWALTQDKATDDLRVWQLEEGRWHPMLEWMGSGTTPVALDDIDGAALVITPFAVFMQEGDSLSGAELEEPLPTDHARTGVAPSGTVFVGFTKSSPHLRAIDPITGSSVDVECGRSGCPSPEYFVPDPAGGDCVVAVSWHDEGPRTTRACAADE